MIAQMQKSLQKGKGGRLQFPQAGKVIKKVVSNILQQKRDWKETKDGLPEDDKPVVIRLLHPSKIMYEDQEVKLPLEDCKIAKYNHEDKKWEILPPHAKYDYSPLSMKVDVNEETIVSHWANILPDELSNWGVRFDRILQYEKLELSVSTEMEELVYKAIIHAAAALSKEAGPYLFRDPTDEEKQQMHPDVISVIQEIRLYHSIMCDLQYAIDNSETAPVETASE